MIRALASLLLVCLAAADSAPAQGVDGPVIAGVRVGFAGRYKAGLWTPVEVRFEGGVPPASELVLTVPDGDGVPSQVVAPVEAARGAGPQAPDRAGPGNSHTEGLHSILLYARFGRVRSELAVELRRGDAVLAARTFRAGDDFPPAISSESGLIVTVAPAPLGVEEAARLLAQGGSQRATVVRLDDPQELPTQWYGYEGVDALFLSSSQAEIYADLGPSDARVAALDEWILMGGRLVLCVGGEAEAVLAPGAPLERFAPGRLQGMVSLRQTRSLETYTASAKSIAPRNAGGFGRRVPRLADVRGKVEAREGNLPLVVRTAHGFGQVVFLAVDLDQPPVDTWADRGRLVARLLGTGSAAGSGESEQGASVMHYGYTDMAGQLRSALDRFAGVRPIPFALVVAVVVLYVLAIGPGDYFFLRKVLRRMELTWITFPLAVAVVAAAALFLADRFKGDRVRVNQISMVDVDVESGRLRGTAWANVFSPKMDRYNLAFEPPRLGSRETGPTHTLCAWLGLPGSALGGMDPKTTDPVVWKDRYQFTRRLDGLLGVPIPIWSTRSFTARWTAPARAYPKAELVQEDELPAGTITNTLGFPLRGCLLAYGRWAYPLGTIEPGGSVDVGPMVPRRELRMLLTGRKMIYDEASEQFRQRATPYDRGSADPAYVLRTMAFYAAAGGRRYTGLANRYQAFVDLSRLLATDRAVLLAMAPDDDPQTPGHGARLVRDGEPIAEGANRHPTLYRFVFPVAEDQGKE